MRRKIFLFDIDGTLLKGMGTGTKALEQAFFEIYGWSDAVKTITSYGLTDRIIFDSIVTEKERFDLVGDKKALDEVFSRYTELLDLYLELDKKAILLKGAVELVEKLHARHDCYLGLLTGNIEEGARIKLEHFGIWQYFTFGAYGDESDTRSGLFSVAKKKFDHLYAADSIKENYLVIGDTPRDVQVGTDNGVKSVGVCTGAYESSDLEGATLIYNDFSDYETVYENLLKIMS